MSFDPKSLNRLKELGRELPKTLPSPNYKANKNPSKDTKSHSQPSNEDNPQSLFYELINASDEKGRIPDHLIHRLKNSEEAISQGTSINLEREQDSGNNNKHIDLINHYPKTNKKSTKGVSSEEDILYASFSRLLLEEDD